MNTFFQACVEVGMPICLDNNSGDPVGVGLAQFNVRRGERSYAANAFLDDTARAGLRDLTVLTDTECDKVCSNGRIATGVDLYHKATKRSGRPFICLPFYS